jgi:hypothetical protein
VPAVADAYASSGYGDELTMSALFLAWATHSSAHYLAAEHFYSQYHLSGQDTVLNWDDRSPALPVLFAQVMKISPATALGANRTAGDWQKESEVYFDRIVQGKSQGYMTKGGPTDIASMLLGTYHVLCRRSIVVQRRVRLSESEPSPEHSDAHDQICVVGVN